MTSANTLSTYLKGHDFSSRDCTKRRRYLLQERVQEPICLLPGFVVQQLSHIQLFATPQIAAHQASFFFTISQSLLRFLSTVMPSNHLILCHPLSQQQTVNSPGSTGLFQADNLRSAGLSCQKLCQCLLQSLGAGRGRAGVDKITHAENLWVLQANVAVPLRRGIRGA